MKLNELIKKLEFIKSRGFIEAKRKGPTGIGHLIENELGLSETNLPIPDIGGRVELKATRKNSNSLLTLFTFNRGVWRIKQSELIKRFGYVDNNYRPALYLTVYHQKCNNQGFYFNVDRQRELILLMNENEKNVIAEWSIYVITGKFMTKLDRLIMILADSKIENDREYFHFNEAYLLENPTPQKFIQAFEQNEILIDIRMHLKTSGGVRNHGTAFRITEKNLVNLYEKRKQLI